MNLSVSKPNNIGVLASSICLVHCLATPLIFVASICTSTCCESSPVWWKSLDYIFLGIALFAVYHSSKQTTKKWISVGLWASWFALLLVIINESIQLIYLPEEVIYIPTLGLIVLHIYNRKFCQCENPHCNITKDKIDE